MPLVVGTRIPADTILDYLETDSGLQELAEDYPSLTGDRFARLPHLLNRLGNEPMDSLWIFFLFYEVTVVVGIIVLATAALMRLIARRSLKSQEGNPYFWLSFSSYLISLLIIAATVWRAATDNGTSTVAFWRSAIYGALISLTVATISAGEELNLDAA